MWLQSMRETLKVVLDCLRPAQLTLLIRPVVPSKVRVRVRATTDRRYGT